MTLGQQRMETAPQRSVIVPAGCASVWGVDASSRAVSVAVDGPDGRYVRTRSFAPLEGARRLSAIYADTREVAAWIASTDEPGLIVMEVSLGGQVNIPLVMALAVVQAGLYDGACTPLGRPHFEEVVSGWWKKAACGHGGLRKPKREKGAAPCELTDYAVFRWAVAEGWNPDSWDAADAIGVCVAARRTWRLIER